MGLPPRDNWLLHSSNTGPEVCDREKTPVAQGSERLAKDSTLHPRVQPFGGFIMPLCQTLGVFFLSVFLLLSLGLLAKAIFFMIL